MMVKKFQLLDLDMKLNQLARSVEREEVPHIEAAPSNLRVIIRVGSGLEFHDKYSYSAPDISIFPPSIMY